MNAFEALLWAIAAAWCLSALMALLNWRLLPDLSRESEGAHPLPSLSVVIPARNEEARIEEAVAAHCSQDYPDLEVIVVDDGSTDATPTLLASLSERFSNLRVETCGEPPSGWMGKPNALRAGFEASRGEMVLFADADVVYGPGAHRMAAGQMVRGDLDMLVVLPRQEGPWGAQLVVSLLDSVCLYGMPSFLYNVPRFKIFALGAGAGNLVKRSALVEAGGLEALRGEVVEDIAMGRMVKALRGRLRVVTAFDSVRIRMYPSFREAMEGFTKNAYAFLGYSPTRAVLGSLAGILIHVLPVAALLCWPILPARVLAPAAMAASLELVLECLARLWSGHTVWLAPLYPLRALLWVAIMARSARRYHAEGLVWRGRTYHGKKIDVKRET